VSTLNSNINGIEYVMSIEENFINIKIPLRLENELIVESFFSQLDKIELKELISNWFIDENNSSIISPNKIFFLTKKELIFIQLLLKNKIVTYEQMQYYLWEDKINITQNAIKSFVKNFKKKIPPSVLKNLNGVGYRLKVDIL
jgi:DNA-binding response OmpR family regulator